MDSNREAEKSLLRLEPIQCDQSDPKPRRIVDNMFPEADEGLSPSKTSSDKDNGDSCPREIFDWTLDQHQSAGSSSCQSSSFSDQPFSSSSDQPSICSDQQLELSSFSCDQPEPISPSIDHQEYSNNNSIEQQSTSCSSDLVSIGSSSDSQEPASCSNNENESNGYDSELKEPSSCLSDHPESVRIGSDEREPSNSRRDQELFLSYSIGQEPSSYNSEHQNPFSCTFDQLEPRTHSNEQLVNSNNDQQEGTEEITCDPLGLTSDVISANYPSSGFANLSGLWNFDSNLSSLCTSSVNSSSLVTQSDYNDRESKDVIQPATSSPTGLRSWYSDAYLDSDIIPIDRSGCNWYLSEQSPELHQPRYGDVQYYSSTPQRFEKDGTKPLMSNQSRAPTLRIPDLSQFNVEPNQGQLSPTEEQFDQFQGSALNFLNNILSTNLSKEDYQDTSFRTEPNPGYVSPTEYLNSPHDSSQFSAIPSGSLEGQTTQNDNELNVLGWETISYPVVPSAADSNGNWQQFTVELAKDNQQNVMENQQNIEHVSNVYQTNYNYPEFSEAGDQQFTPYSNVSYVPCPASSNFNQIEFSVTQNQGNIIGNYVEDHDQLNGPCGYQINQSSATDALDSRLSGFQDTSSSNNVSSNSSVNMPPNSTVFVTNGDEPCYTQQTMPIVPSLQFQGKPTQIFYRQAPKSFQQISPNVSFPQQQQHMMESRSQVSRHRDQIPLVNNGGIIFPGPVNVWKDAHNTAQIYNPSTYQNCYHFSPSVNTQVELRRDSEMCNQNQPSCNVEDPESKKPVPLVPLPEHFVLPQKRYSCQVEHYARNFPRYTAIQSLASDGPCQNRCCEQNMKCFPQKQGAVSIKTKEGKFLCMAIDFHTKTVREILDSAENCKERVKAASVRKDDINKNDEVCKDSETNSGTNEDSRNVGDNSMAETNTVEEIICVTDSESPETCSNKDANNLLIRQSPPQVMKNELSTKSPLLSNRDLSTDINQDPIQQECNTSRSSKIHDEVDVIMTEDGENSGFLNEGGRNYVPEQNVPDTEAQTTRPTSTSVPIESMCELPAVSRSASLPPTVYPNDLLSLNSARADPHRQLPVLHGYPGKELIYRGTVHLNTPFVPGNPSPHLRDLPPPQNHHPDHIQPVVLNPGDEGYSPMLPSREVQLSTAQPFPLHPSMFNGPSYPPISHPYFMPHAPSYPSGYNFMNPSSMGRGVPVDVGRFGAHHNTHHTAGSNQAWHEAQALRDRPGNPYHYPQSSYPFAGFSSSNTGGLSNFVFSKKLKNQRESLNKIAFKPKHFEFTSLQIGNYKYCTDVVENKTAKLKLLYSKKKLVYEFQLNEVKEMYEDNHRKLALVEIPFDGIVQLSGEGCEFKIEVSVPPKVYQGQQMLKAECKFGVHANAKYKRCEEEDMTDGEIHHVPYHYIQLKGNLLDKLTHFLELYDERFEMLMHMPFVEEPGKLLGQSEKPKLLPITKQRRNLDIGKEESTNTGPGILRRNREMIFGGCHCQTGCKTGRCSCSRSLKPCTALCQCCNCVNLFNLLNKHNITTKEAREDSCLLHSLFKVMDLQLFLKTEVTLPCCKLSVTIRQCIPGETRCPNYPRCLARYKFSWCSGTLCDQAKSPRNHCKICKSCCGKQYRHCGSCNRCYFAGLSGFSCPTCNNAEVRRRENQPLNMLSDAEIIRNILPT